MSKAIEGLKEDWNDFKSLVSEIPKDARNLYKFSGLQEDVSKVSDGINYAKNTIHSDSPYWGFVPFLVGVYGGIGIGYMAGLEEGAAIAAIAGTLFIPTAHAVGVRKGRADALKDRE